MTVAEGIILPEIIERRAVPASALYTTRQAAVD